MANINVKNMIFGNFFMDKSIAPMDGWFTKSWHINNFLFMNMAAWQALCIYIYYYIHMFFFSLSLSLSFSPSLPPSHGHETNSRCKTLSVWLYICSLAFHLSWFACMHTCVCEREWVWVCVCESLWLEVMEVGLCVMSHNFALHQEVVPMQHDLQNPSKFTCNASMLCFSSMASYHQI